MAGRFSDRADFDIPTDLIREHEWMCDELIDGPTGTAIKLVYPKKKEECPNCLLDPATGRSMNIYKTGGPVSFPNHTTCPWCGGEGHRSASSTDNLRVRFYTNPKDWVPMDIKLATTDGIAQMIGYMVHLPKVQRATEIIAYTTVEGINQYRYQPHSKALPHGFHHDRYFIMLWKESG
jgi:hypothetical protein